MITDVWSQVRDLTPLFRACDIEMGESYLEISYPGAELSHPFHMLLNLGAQDAIVFRFAEVATPTLDEMRMLVCPIEVIPLAVAHVLAVFGHSTLPRFESLADLERSLVRMVSLWIDIEPAALWTWYDLDDFLTRVAVECTQDGKHFWTLSTNPAELLSQLELCAWETEP
ncbi:hypothetical protein ACL1HR_08385 [Corynebacterium striatum]